MASAGEVVALIAALGGGGGGGTDNYNSLSNKPKINGVTLQGDKSSADLGLEVNPDNITIDYNASDEVEVKDGGLTVAKMNATAVATAIGDVAVNTKLTTEKAVKDYVDEFVKDGLVENTDTDSVRNITITLLDKNNTSVYSKTLSNFILKTRKVAGLDLADDITAQEVQDAIKDLTATLTHKTINADDNTITELETDNLKNGVLRKSTDGLQSTTDDTHLISEKLAEDLLKLRLEKVTSMPTASADRLGDAVLYIGTTTSVAPIYTNMHIYKCVVSSGVHSWADLGTAIDTVETSVDTANNLTITLKSNGVIVSSSTVAIVTTSIVETAYFDATTNELVIEFSNGQSLRFNLTALLADLLPMAIGFTMETASWTSDGAGGYMYDLTSAINAILANIPVYNAAEQVFTAVTPAGSENPQELHWCELTLGGGYVLSTDTTVDSGKTYYASSQVPATLQWYEKALDGTYSLSVDTYVNPAKTYFVKSAKTLTGTYQFNATADKTAQAVLDAGTATQIVLVTTKVGGVWKLYAMAKDGKPNAQLTLPVIMLVVNPTVNDMTIVGQAIYKSVASIPSDTVTLTNKTINADDNTITDLEGDNFKSSAIGSGLEVVSKVLKHSNSVTAASTQALAKVSYDAQGHITGSTGVGTDRGVDITGNNIGHTNSVTADDDDITLSANGIAFKKLSYDAQGHISANASGKTLTFRNGIKSDTSGNIEHTNAVTAQTTAKLGVLKFDAQGHITEFTEKAVVDNLTSTATDQPLSANQGKVLEQTKVKLVQFSSATTSKTRAQFFALATKETETVATVGSFATSDLPPGATTTNRFSIFVNKVLSTYGSIIVSKGSGLEMYASINVNGTWGAWQKIQLSGDIVNNLTSTATDKSLSAAQGKALNDKIRTGTAAPSGSANTGDIYIRYS